MLQKNKVAILSKVIHKYRNMNQNNVYCMHTIATIDNLEILEVVLENDYYTFKWLGNNILETGRLAVE